MKRQLLFVTVLLFIGATASYDANAMQGSGHRSGTIFSPGSGFPVIPRVGIFSPPGFPGQRPVDTPKPQCSIKIITHPNGTISIEVIKKDPEPNQPQGNGAAQIDRDQSGREKVQKKEKGETEEKEAKKRRVINNRPVSDGKQLSDVPTDALTVISSFMLTPDPGSQQQEINVINQTKQVKLVSKAFNEAFTCVTESSPFNKFSAYMRTYKKRLTRPTIWLYLKLVDMYGQASITGINQECIISGNEYLPEHIIPIALLFQMDADKNELSKNKFESAKRLAEQAIYNQLNDFVEESTGSFKEPYFGGNYCGKMDNIYKFVWMIGLSGNINLLEWFLKTLSSTNITQILRLNKAQIFGIYDSVHHPNEYLRHTIGFVGASTFSKSATPSAPMVRHLERALLYALKKNQPEILKLLRRYLGGCLARIFIRAQLAKRVSPNGKKQLIKMIEHSHKEITDLPESEAVSFFRFAAACNDIATMRKILKNYKPKILRCTPTFCLLHEALDAAMDHRSNDVVEYLQKHHAQTLCTEPPTVERLPMLVHNPYRIENLHSTLRVAAKRNFLKVIKLICKNKNFARKVLIPLAPELLLIAVKHGSYEVITFLFEKFKPALYNRIRRMSRGFPFHGQLQDPITLDNIQIQNPVLLAATVAAELATKTKSKEARAVYKRIIQYLRSQDPAVEAALIFFRNTTNKKTPNNKKEKKS